MYVFFLFIFIKHALMYTIIEWNKNQNKNGNNLGRLLNKKKTKMQQLKNLRKKLLISFFCNADKSR